jgi:hypothetical protein
MAMSSVLEMLILEQAKSRLKDQMITVFLNRFGVYEGREDRRRQVYPEDAPRDESGHVIGECCVCGHILPIVASFNGKAPHCRHCYGKWYRHNHPRKPRLGSAP